MSRLWAGPGLTKKGLGISGPDPPAVGPKILDSETRGGAGPELEKAGLSGAGGACLRPDRRSQKGRRCSSSQAAN